jgi:hypothetical protein
MNVNEECLLKFLNNPGRLELTTNELKNINISINGKLKLNKDELIKKIRKNSSFISKNHHFTF